MSPTHTWSFGSGCEIFFGTSPGIELIDIRLEIFRTLLQPLERGRLLDLGCGHGKFSVIARDLGWSVTAVDARTERMPFADGIEWIQADVRMFPIDGYDCICILGLLYHLELSAQLDLLRRCKGTLTILDTHVSLKPTHEEHGYAGHLFEEKTEAATASWGNPASFWPTEESLLRMLRDAGFGVTLKLEPGYLPNRTFFIAS